MSRRISSRTSRTSRETLGLICEKADITRGTSLKDICKIMTERPKTFTKDNLVVVAKMLDIALLPKDTKEAILKKLKNKLEENPSKNDKIVEEVVKDIEDQEEVFEQKVVEENKKQNINSVIIRDCIVYNGPRRLIIVPVPSHAFEKRQEKNKPVRYTWKGHSMSGTFDYNTENKNCGFYFSTGTSNEGKNFSGMWFPFGRIKVSEKKYSEEEERGWINKMNNLAVSRNFLKALEKKGIVITPFLLAFLEKFSHWWQIGISACLPYNENCYWNTHEELIKLRPLAITTKYDWHFGDVLDDKTADEIVTQYELIAECYDIPEYKIPEKVNEWLITRDALTVKNDY